MNSNDIATECIWCGGYIHAGSYPPICDSNNCRFEIELAVAYEEMARENNKAAKGKDDG